jgi:hypothetical protein
MFNPPKRLPIDRTTINSRKGPWLTAVETVAETESDGQILIKRVLEQNIDEAHSARVAKAREARDPDGLPNITNRIPDWIESTEGDGFLDLA